MPICGTEHEPPSPKCAKVKAPFELSPLSTQMRTADLLNSVGLWRGNVFTEGKERILAGGRILSEGYGLKPSPVSGLVLLTFILVAVHLLRVHARLLFTLALLFFWGMMSS